MTFTLDASGVISIPNDDPYGPTYVVYTWSSLSPFAQGYVEALFGDLNGRRIRATSDGLNPYRFSDLSPEALAMILADCERRLRHCPSEGSDPGPSFARTGEVPRECGRRFWKWRQQGNTKNFPPLTPYLADDGKVHLRVAA